MSDRLDEALKHHYVYVPRGKQKNTLQPGKRLGFAIAREHRTPLTVLAPRKDSATHDPELAKQTIVTERSGHVNDDGVVLAWRPTLKVMEKIQHLENSVVVLVEWIPGEFNAWAKLNKAYNVVTGEVMDARLSEEALEILKGIVFEGYNGWSDTTSERMTRSYLDDLAQIGAYDRWMVLAYARQTKYEASVQRLKKILDEFEEKTVGSSAKPGRREL